VKHARPQIAQILYNFKKNKFIESGGSAAGGSEALFFL
jgi:hypothetical protein